jgi:hypothetical protein
VFLFFEVPWIKKLGAFFKVTGKLCLIVNAEFTIDIVGMIGDGRFGNAELFSNFIIGVA